MENEYRTYRDTIAVAIRILYPEGEVETAGLDELADRVGSFGPHVVVSSRPNTLDQDDDPSWVELPIKPTWPAKIYVGGRYAELADPTLEVILQVIEETERLLQANGDSGDR